MIESGVAEIQSAQIAANLERQAEEAAKERERLEAERIKQETYEAYRKELNALQDKYPDHWDDTKDAIKYDDCY
jgi:hypothetical protein